MSALGWSQLAPPQLSGLRPASPPAELNCRISNWRRSFTRHQTNYNPPPVDEAARCPNRVLGRVGRDLAILPPRGPGRRALSSRPARKCASPSGMSKVSPSCSQGPTNRLAERFEHQNNVWNLAMMNSLAFLLPGLRRRSGRCYMRLPGAMHRGGRHTRCLRHAARACNNSNSPRNYTIWLMRRLHGWVQQPDLS
jgi:hypothetical protein